MLTVIYVSVLNKPFTLSVGMLNVSMLSVFITLNRNHTFI
jgi:hypothetical protein